MVGRKQLKQVGKQLVRTVASRVPAPAGRLNGAAAIAGGKPVRDTRLRPWPDYPSHSPLEWVSLVEPALRRVFLSGSEGLPQTEANRFSAAWAAYCGVPHALLLPHGTDALRVALASTLPVDHAGRVDAEVIVPNLSFIASVNSALDRGLKVALVDVLPDTLTLDPAKVEAAVRPGITKAIMPVHLFGLPADIEGLRKVAARHNLVIIEDAAQAHGAVHSLGPVGSLGDSAAFSFQSSKNLASGEGGALTTRDRALYERAWSMHNAGRSFVAAQRWGHESFGLNLRPSEYVAALLSARLQNLEAETERRWANFQRLHKLLERVGCVTPLAVPSYVKRHGVHLFALRYQPDACGGLALPDFMRSVLAENVPLCRGYELTLSNQPALRKLRASGSDMLRVEDTPAADSAVANLLYIPHQLFLGRGQEMEEVAAAFAKVERHHAGASARLPRQGVMQAQGGRAVAAPAAPPLRVGIVGMGEMGRLHATLVRENPSYVLAAVADANVAHARQQGASLGCSAFGNTADLLQGASVDLLVVASPHKNHVEDVLAALERGVHVLCEKPLCILAADADRVLEAQLRSKARLVVNQQRRLDPGTVAVKALLDGGELGRVYHCAMVESSWRSQAYYDASPWRGTWAGEGGGVIVNQGPHVLDRYLWLFGRPASLLARWDNVLHRIEVEDTVSVSMFHDSGMHGQLHASTVDGPGSSRLALSCDRGRVVLEDGSLHVTQYEGSVAGRTFQAGSPPALKAATYRVPVGNVPGDQLQRQLYAELPAALQGHPGNLCTAQEAVRVVELMNALHLSGALRQEVALPLDRTLFGAWSTQHQATHRQPPSPAPH